jgi:cellulose synthase/poly-beta-1,6-N-acetylglucosamine synthase-like glycosyltransferase
VVGVFDAEDQVHPLLLEHVDHAFRATGADVVQGGVQLINYHSSWYSLHNCLEYFFWFRSRLHLHAAKGFIPLGGNTVFVRTEVLREANGWDGSCLAEDCDLGVRLSSRGKKVVVAYDSSLVTREETPDSLPGLIKQRTRWNQGFLHVFRKGEWRRLPTFGQRLLARYTLTGPFVQAFSGVVIPVGVCIALFAHVSILIAMLTFLPVVPMVMTIIFQAVGLRDFGKLYGLRIRMSDYARLVLGAFPYMVVLSVAAVRAVWREYTGRRNWELTRHVGAHLGANT